MQSKLTPLFFFIFLLTVCACKSTKSIVPATNLNNVKADIEYLASDKLEGRETGTAGERLAAEYIKSRFETIGLQGIFEGDEKYYQYFQKTIKSNPHAEKASPDDPVVIGKNVGAFVDNKSDHTIIIGAHYDHLGLGGEGSLHTGEPAIHNGADDNASGIAAMLSLATYISKHKWKSNFLFLAFSGEEKGLWGSNFFVDNSPIGLDDINYMINMDMVGRLNDKRQLAIYGTGTSPVWSSTLERIKSPTFELSTKESGVGPSDHTSFYLEDIPVLHFFTGQHDDYHRPSDDHEKINYAGISDIVQYISSILVKLDAQGKLAFTKTKDDTPQRRDFKVTLGVIPDYLYNEKGMRIDGVREERPAANAGILKGDIIIKIGDVDIVDMMSYMQALGSFEPGQIVKVKLIRGEEMMELDVTF